MSKKSRINVLFISHSSELGGAERSLLDLLKNINKNRFNPIVIIPYKGAMENELKKINIQFYCRFIDYWIPSTMNFGFQHFFRFFIELRGRLWSIVHLIEHHNIDIIYTNTITVIDAALVAKKFKIPHIWHIREYPVGNQDIKSYLPFSHTIVNYLSTHLITNSKSLKSKVKSNIVKRPISIVYNGVAIRDNNSLNFPFNSTYNNHIVTTVCTISPNKDLEIFLMSANILIKTKKDITFLLVGDGNIDYIQHLKSLVIKYDIVQHVQFMGQRQDALSIMKHSDIVTLTSKQEAFGRVIIEAMSVGTPVISTDSGGPSEIIKNGVDGFLIPIGDAVALASKINLLLDNPEIADKISLNGLKKSSKMFNIDNYVKSIENIIDSTASL